MKERMSRYRVGGGGVTFKIWSKFGTIVLNMGIFVKKDFFKGEIF